MLTLLKGTSKTIVQSNQHLRGATICCQQTFNQVRTAGGEKSFLRGLTFFKLCPVVSNNVQHIFQNLPGWRSLP